MIGRLREAGLLWSALVAIVVFAALVALGNWQWSRMHWKQGLLEDLKQAATAEPIAMNVVPRATQPPDAKLEALRFRRIVVTGTFEHANELHVWAPAAQGPAWSVVTPLRLKTDAAKRTGFDRQQASHIFVIRGDVPEAIKDAAKRVSGQLADEVSITGRIRLDHPNSYANEPNITKNQWFTRDLKTMRAHFQKTLKRKVNFAPFFLEAEQQTGGPLAPKPNLRALSLSNRHLEYALTWWALALTLVGVFAVFALGRLRAE